MQSLTGKRKARRVGNRRPGPSNGKTETAQYEGQRFPAYSYGANYCSEIDAVTTGGELICRSSTTL